MTSVFTLRFLGTGSAHAHELGCSAAVLERDAAPTLLIDCGLDTVQLFQTAYDGRLPTAVYITHNHLDHIGGLESLFYKAYFNTDYCGRIRLYVPVQILESLHRRIADNQGVVAEGGVNFWDCFQLVPVTECFWHDELAFRCFPVLHHGHHSAFGIALSGVFLYTGDTRPVPEIINKYACCGEMIFHEGCLAGNLSHTNIAEVHRYYRREQLNRMIFYHYQSAETADQIEHLGYKCAVPGQTFTLGVNCPEKISASAPSLKLLGSEGL
jgi:ribonuclease BN (tRNA processing enzyme)